MNVALHLISYAALLTFLAAVAFRFARIQRYPLHARWDIQPIPHEGERSKHGGSIMEETDWWTKEHKPDKIMELKFMIAEMVFLKGLFEHNRKLWYRSFPFHFGLYLLAAFGALLFLGAILDLAGASFAPLTSVAAALGLVGFVLAIAGSLSLLLARFTDDDLKPHTNFSHYFNLLFIALALILALAAFLSVGLDQVPLRAYIGSLITFDLSADIADPLTKVAILAVSLLIAYIPLTHMSHFFVKWFTWHKIRWDDTPNVKGGRIEVLVQKALEYPVSWPADHIRGDGKKTWADVATEEIEN